MAPSVDRGPVAGPSGAELDQIRLSGIRAHGYHGVFGHERAEGQTFIADLVLHVDIGGIDDDLSRTVDYGAVAEQVAAVLGGPAVNLIETLAEQIATVALTHPPVHAVDVVVHKPQAPIRVPFDDVTVAIRRRRGDGAPGRIALGAQMTAAGGGVAGTPMIGAPPLESPGPTPLADALGDGPTDRLDLPPDEPVPVVLALGANLGDARQTLRRAIADLEQVPGLKVTTVSPLARTAPVGGPEQPDFLNAVVLGSTTLAPRALLRECQAIEEAHGRVRDTAWGPRTLDIDLIVVGSVIAVTDDLELPHPRAHERAFVLTPWSLADPHAVLPGLGGGPVTALAETAPDRAGIRWVALDWLTADEPAEP